MLNSKKVWRNLSFVLNHLSFCYLNALMSFITTRLFTVYNVERDQKKTYVTYA